MSETPIADQVAEDLGTPEWVEGAEDPKDSVPAEDSESSDETAAA